MPSLYSFERLLENPLHYRVEPILYHVFSSSVTHLLGDEGPLASVM